MQRLNQRIRVEEQLQNGVQDLSDPPNRRTMGLVQSRLFEDVVGHLDRRLGPPKLIEQIGTDAAWIEEFFQLDGGELANLLLGVIDAAFFTNARADLLHDLLDVERVGADIEVGHNRSSPFRT